MWDGVDRQSAGPLIFRSIQGSCTNIINYSVTKYLPLTLIAIVNNMGPLVTVILAYFLLKERIKRTEIIILILTVGGVVEVVSTGDPQESTAASSISKTLLIIMYSCLFCNPILVAGGSIVMRKMKKFHPAVVSFYLNWSIGLISLAVILAMGANF